MKHKERFFGKSRDCIAKTICECSGHIVNFNGNTSKVAIYITLESLDMAGETRWVEGFIEFSSKEKTNNEQI